MSCKIYVGNLSWNTNDDGLRQAFSPYGQVLDSIVMRDRETGRSRGFGFVTYGSPDEANAAIAALNEQELDGRRVKVNLANARATPGAASYAAAPPSGFPGYGGGGYSGGAQGFSAYPQGYAGQGAYYSGQQGYQGSGYGAYQQPQGGGGYY